ncbi:MAG TPA: DUF2889 domain-containing protein [Syntrophomonadaceae bacterium]|jgi:hypothetical protein|nr:DUF2889 domain-containing protein [Syntrophomonadaceae bacterium]
MEFLYQRYWHSEVYRAGDHLICGRTMYADSDRELAVSMVLDTVELKIQEAYWEKYGSPGDMREYRKEIPDLKGIQAYLGQGPHLRRAAENLGEDMARSMINETVTCIVQAETFLLLERGYTGKEDYNQAWDHFYDGSCRYYSNLDRVQCSWGDYIGNQARENRLFDRFKSQHIYREQGVGYMIAGNLRDSFHHISSWLEIEADVNQVLRAEASLMQVPDEVCRESIHQLKNIEGLCVRGMKKKELAQHLGAGQGCVHLIDLVYDSVDTYNRCLNKQLEQSC